MAKSPTLPVNRLKRLLVEADRDNGELKPAPQSL